MTFARCSPLLPRPSTIGVSVSQKAHYWADVTYASGSIRRNDGPYGASTGLPLMNRSATLDGCGRRGTVELQR